MSTTNGAVHDLDVNALIDSARLAERTIALCLRGDLQAQFEDLERRLDEAAERDQGDSLASGSSVAAIRAQMEELRDQMRASTLVVTLRALPRKAYQRLSDQHPPRRDDEGNVVAEDRTGVNMLTFWDPLIRACWVAPELDKARMTHLLDEVLSNNQYDSLASLALLVNQGKVDIPFLSAASLRNRDSESE